MTQYNNIVTGKEIVERDALSRREVAQRSGTSTRFVDEEILRGNLKARKRSRRVWILVADYQRWLGGGKADVE